VAGVIDPADVARRLDAVRTRIGRAGRDPDGITIVAVTKGFGADAVGAAQRCGLADIGENYAQELLAKAQELRVPVRWHFIGQIQTNKVRALAPLVALWHGVDRLHAGEAIARHQPEADVLVEVNTAGDPAKGGCRPDEAPELVLARRGAGLRVRGLMTIAAAGPPESARPAFRALAALAQRLELPELSMGMTADLEVAVQEGATMIRVGEALFGPRSLPADLRR
jgi:pyridoxal phosphate enzyme (YggS family)